MYNTSIFPGSSMVEQEAVNFEVTGSSPVRGATTRNRPVGSYFLVVVARNSELNLHFLALFDIM